jgi:hypothetical protein
MNCLTHPEFSADPVRPSVRVKIESDLEWAGLSRNFNFSSCCRVAFSYYFQREEIIKKRLIRLILTKKLSQSEKLLKILCRLLDLEDKMASNTTWTQSTAIFQSLVARQFSWSDACQFSSIFDKVNYKQINSFKFISVLVKRATAHKKNIYKILIKKYLREIQNSIFFADKKSKKYIEAVTQ